MGEISSIRPDSTWFRREHCSYLLMVSRVVGFADGIRLKVSFYPMWMRVSLLQVVLYHRTLSFFAMLSCRRSGFLKTLIVC